jgi:membrane associated rhomboid family serine protease
MRTLSIAPRMHFLAWQRRHSFAVDALIALALLLLVVFALIALLALVGSTDPSVAAAAAVGDGNKLILPP